MLKYGLLTVLAAFLAPLAAALEIPLKKGAGGGITVGYVDMEAVFQEYPETKKAKNDYYVELAKRREDLAKREQELSVLRQQISVLMGTLQESGNAPSPDTPQAPLTDATALSVSSMSIAAANASVMERKRDLTQREQQLEQARIEAAKAVKDMEETRSLQILGKLYKEMVQLAEENNISLIVDKSSILYGHQAIDLTDKMSRRIRGLPETDEFPR